MQIYKGNIVHTPTPDRVEAHVGAFIIVKDGQVEGIYEELPPEYKSKPVKDFGKKLILPGFVDLHVHASQYLQCGLGLDKGLLDWLNNHTYPAEKRFSDLSFAREVYTLFVDELIRRGTLRAAIFATIHRHSTEILFEILMDKGLGAYVGKVNMDRNCPGYLKENTGESVRETEEILIRYGGHFLVKPIITPRFPLCCSEDLMKGLGSLAVEYKIPVQSHLAETPGETEQVKKLFPSQPTYSDVYLSHGLFGETPTLMAHGIYLTARDVKLIKDRRVMLVHCPTSNINLASGLMPARKWLQQGLPLGLGSDVGAGHTLSMAEVITAAMGISKIIGLNGKQKPLTVAEAFYMATKGGGSFFGKVGSFEKGYKFDAIVAADNILMAEHHNPCLTPGEQLEKFLYTGDAGHIVARFVEGKEIAV